MNTSSALSILLTDKEISKYRTNESRAFLARAHNEVFPAAHILSAITQLLNAANILLERHDEELVQCASFFLTAAHAAVEMLPHEIVTLWKDVLARESRFSSAKEIRELSRKSRSDLQTLRAYQNFYAAIYTDRAAH